MLKGWKTNIEYPERKKLTLGLYSSIICASKIEFSKWFDFARNY
jgi:hypothetical protein